MTPASQFRVGDAVLGMPATLGADGDMLTLDLVNRRLKNTTPINPASLAPVPVKGIASLAFVVATSQSVTISGLTTLTASSVISLTIEEADAGALLGTFYAPAVANKVAGTSFDIKVTTLAAITGTVKVHWSFVS